MAESAGIAGDIASAIQSASINRHPDARHDLNPSTAASIKEPVRLSSQSAAQHEPLSPSPSSSAEHIPANVLRPVPRRQALPPLPDLRFEQSYLKSISLCESRAAVLWVTLRDQVLLALFQGFAWTLLLSGWRHVNRASKLSGSNVGARLRRWWWGVNGWSIPVGTEREQKGEMVREFYEARFGSSAES